MPNKLSIKYKYATPLLLLLYLVTLIYCFYIGYYETIYSLGVSATIMLQTIGLAVFLIHMLVTRLIFTRRYRLIKSVMLSVAVVTTIQIIFIIGHRIDKYKPTFTISIPEDYSGCVYLFNTPDERKDITVSQFGIGYIGSKGKAQWRLHKGKIDITEAYETSQSHEILVYNKDSLQLTSYRIQCLDLNPANAYPKRQSDYEVNSCLDSKTFLEMIIADRISENKLQKLAWTRNHKDSNWVLDKNNSHWSKLRHQE